MKNSCSLLSGRFTWFSVAAIFILFSGATSCFAQSGGGGDPTPNVESLWRELITTSITSPTTTQYIYINEQVSYSASATCMDQFSNDGGTTWNDYGVDTASPAPSITWSVVGYGTLSTYSGTSTTYTAPDGSVVNYEIFDQIYAGATTSGNDIYGVPATTQSSPTTIPATQPAVKIHVTCSQAFRQKVTGSYPIAQTDGIPDNVGGLAPDSGIKGWMIPNHPANVDGYYGGTELTGTRTDAHFSYANLFWTQTKGALLGSAQGGAALPNPLPVAYAAGTPDITRNMIGTQSAPVDLTGPLYLFDAPGFTVDVTNNRYIADGDTAVGVAVSLSTYVVDAGNNTVSDTCNWTVSFTLGIDPATTNTWKAAPGHTP